MVKVITYGTYDLLHYGHVRLLKRAKALGDYLIVGVTADGYDRSRGKINVKQSLIERVEGVRATGIPDEIIVEEYEGQKIDDIRRYDIDIFTVGSDWKGQFDYLNEYCKVIYLERTQGVSSSELRSAKRNIRLGLVGESNIVNKFEQESHYINGLEACGVCTQNDSLLSSEVKALPLITSNLTDLLSVSDAVYIVSPPKYHYDQIKTALEMDIHVLCESPITLSVDKWKELMNIAEKKHCILMDSIKTAYATAYYRMLLLVKTGIVGKVISVDSICTSMREHVHSDNLEDEWNSICAWGPTGILPVFQLLGTGYKKKEIISLPVNKSSTYDLFTKVALVYKEAMASTKVGQGVKSEGELIVSGTKGYIYVPAPWWKTDYFEVRYENPVENRRYFYQLDGEGIRYELLTFVRAIRDGISYSYIDRSVSEAIITLIEDYYSQSRCIII